MYQAYHNGRKDTNTPSGQGATYDDVQQSAQHLKALTSRRPQIGIICGSGLGGLVDMLDEAVAISYEDIPNFPVSTAPGHAGKLVFGELRGKSCVCMQGRLHLYEGYPAWQVAFPIRVLKEIGVRILLITNAAGGLNDRYNVGDFMVLKSHLNLPGLAGCNPLVGPNDDRFGPRFPALSDAYDRELRSVAALAANQLNLNFVHEGVYAFASGPCYETVAEAQMMKMLGGDVAGMSTVPEVMVARHCGLRCFAMSVVSNKVILTHDSRDPPANCQEVLDTGRQRSLDCQSLISKMVELIEL